jgi:hypothetical protein
MSWSKLGESNQVKDLVLVTLHQLNSARQGVSANLLPKRDGPYAIRSQKGPTSCIKNE